MFNTDKIMENLSHLEKALKMISIETVSKMKSILSSHGKGSSRLINKIVINVEKENDNLSLSLEVPEYSIFVDKGRRPGKQPPIDIIKSWCKRKHIDISAAFPIAKSIGTYGIPATNFMRPFNEIPKTYSDVIAEALANDIADNIENKTQN